jgi:hypothetical protein
VPALFVDVIEKVYAVPPAKVPVTVNGLDVPVVVREIDGVLVTVKEVGKPPVGVVNGIDTVVLLVTETVPITGLSGTSGIAIALLLMPRSFLSGTSYSSITG